MNNLDVPQRSTRFTKGREIFNSGKYFASVHSFGLVVQNHRTGTGKMLPVSHDQYSDYVEAIETAMDSTEADTLCRALLA
jgi:hypothetical protein